VGSIARILDMNTNCPIGLPHVNSQDEIVNGYLIPKGSLINLNNGYVAKNTAILDYTEGVQVHAQRS
jgi:hypothetical protein